MYADDLMINTGKNRIDFKKFKSHTETPLEKLICFVKCTFLYLLALHKIV